MAAKLQCEICGGKLIGKPGGIFECENCGTEYSTEWAKAKIQEITGTVKVEGTVEVTGKVQIDGPVKVESGPNMETLLKRAFMSLEDAQWDKAKELFDMVLNEAPENAQAYMGLAMTEAHARTRENYKEIYPGNTKVQNSAYAARARQFDPELASFFAALDKQEKERREKRRAEMEKERAAKEEKEAEQAAAKMTAEELEKARRRIEPASHMIAAGDEHTVGLKADGTVVATKYIGKYEYYYGQCEVGSWKDIVAIAAGKDHTVGLRRDGTVTATENIRNDYNGQSQDRGQSKVKGWDKVVAITAGWHHTVGLKKDGTVVATGDNPFGQCNVGSWTDIVAIAAGNDFTVGLKRDGTVLGKGLGDECKVGDWKDIVAIAAGSSHTVGLKADGTVTTKGYNSNDRCRVNDWQNIVAIAAGCEHTVGLRADGTVVAVGSNKKGQCDVSDWTDIVAIAAGDEHTVGIHADGRVSSTSFKGEKEYYHGQCDVGGWKLFRDINTLKDEKDAPRRAKIEELTKEKSELESSKAAIEAELPSLTGVFKAGKRKEAEARLNDINRCLARIAEALRKLG